MSASSRDCITFVKRRPFDDWGNFSFFVKVGDNEPKPVPLREPEPSPYAFPDPDPDFPKLSCPVCTLDNDLTATICDACGSNLK